MGGDLHTFVIWLARSHCAVDDDDASFDQSCAFLVMQGRLCVVFYSTYSTSAHSLDQHIDDSMSAVVDGSAMDQL